MKGCGQIEMCCRRVIFVLIGIIGTIGYGCVSEAELDSRSLVRIHAEGRVGTGFWVDPNTLITAAHCVGDDAVDIRIDYIDDNFEVQNGEGVVVHINHIEDWAIIRTLVEGLPVDVCDAKIWHLASVYGWLDSGIESRSGMILFKKSNRYHVANDIQSGFSGGPGVVDGCVIGVTTDMYDLSRNSIVTQPKHELWR